MTNKKIRSLICLVAAIGIICDIIVKKGIAFIYVENWNSFIIATIQVQGTAVTLAIALFSLLSSVFNQKYYGVRIVDYVLFVDDNYTDLTKLMKCEVALVVSNIVLYLFAEYNTILFLSIYSLCIIIYFIKRFCFIFKSVDEIKSCIVDYVNNLYFSKKDIRNNLYKHIRESIFVNNYINLREYLDFVVNLFDKKIEYLDQAKVGMFFDELSNCIKDCLASSNPEVNLFLQEKIFEIIRLQNRIVKHKGRIDKDIFETLYETLLTSKVQYISADRSLNLLLYELPHYSIDIKFEKEQNGNKIHMPYIYPYYISKYIKNLKSYEVETIEPLSQVFIQYIDMLHYYNENHENSDIRNIILNVTNATIASLYDKEWYRCYEALLFNEYIVKYGDDRSKLRCLFVLVQIMYVYFNRFHNKLDSGNVISNRFKDLYDKYCYQVSVVLNYISGRIKIIFSPNNVQLIFDLLVSRVRYFHHIFSKDDIKEFLLILYFIIEIDDKSLTQGCDCLLAGDYFNMYHYMFRNEENAKLKFEYICSFLGNEIMYKSCDKELYKKFRRTIDSLYFKHRIEQKKEYYDDNKVKFCDFGEKLNVVVKQYVEELTKPFDDTDICEIGEVGIETQKLIELPVEVMGDADYIFTLIKEYIKNGVANILEKCVKGYVTERQQKMSESDVMNYLDSIKDRRFFIGNEDFRYWELGRIQNKISDKISKDNSIISWGEDTKRYLISINLNSLRITFSDTVVNIRDCTEDEILNDCIINNGEYLVKMDAGIRIPLSREKALEYFRYSKKIIEVKYKYNFQIINLDSEDVALKTIFNIGD